MVAEVGSANPTYLVNPGLVTAISHVPRHQHVVIVKSNVPCTLQDVLASFQSIMGISLHIDVHVVMSTGYPAHFPERAGSHKP